MPLKGVFREKLESFLADYTTREGLFTVIIGAIIFGYLVVMYDDVIFTFLIGVVSFLPRPFVQIGAFLLFGLFAAVLELVIVFILAKIFRLLKFKNKRIGL